MRKEANPATISCWAIFIKVDWEAGFFFEYNEPITQAMELSPNTTNAVIRRFPSAYAWALEFTLPFKNIISPTKPITNPIGINLSEK